MRKRSYLVYFSVWQIKEKRLRWGRVYTNNLWSNDGRKVWYTIIYDNLLDRNDWKKIFEEASEIGISFILLAGGEPEGEKDATDNLIQMSILRIWH